jgi:hypothetical protein
MVRRVDLSLRVLRVLRQDPAASADAAQDRVLSGAVPGTSGLRYSLNALDAESGFLARRLTALHEVRADRGSGAAGRPSRASLRQPRARRGRRG